VLDLSGALLYCSSRHNHNAQGNRGATSFAGGSLSKARQLVIIICAAATFIAGSAATALALPIPLAETGVTVYDYNTGVSFAGTSGQSCAGVPPAQSNTCSTVGPAVFSRGTGTATGSAHAVIEVGVRPTITAAASIGDTSISLNKSGIVVGAGGRFADNLTIDLAGCAPGACSGTFVVEFVISGVSNWFSPLQNDSGFAEFFISYDEATLGTGSRYSLQTLEPINHDPTAITVLMPGLPFLSGIPFTIQPAFAVQAQMPFLVPSGYEALNLIAADYSHSFTLSNVYVLDASGRPLSFGITSDSGADYGSSPTAVPEPATVVMIAGALVLFARLNVRRRGAHGQ
jgi:PEP-CTERM motif